jgi:hypothetical protein
MTAVPNNRLIQPEAFIKESPIPSHEASAPAIAPSKTYTPSRARW